MQWYKLIGGAVSIAGGITFVLNLENMNLVGLGIGVVLFVVGIFIMK